jgi:hypothetical protein
LDYLNEAVPCLKLVLIKVPRIFGCALARRPQIAAVSGTNPGIVQMPERRQKTEYQAFCGTRVAASAPKIQLEKAVFRQLCSCGNSISGFRHVVSH